MARISFHLSRLTPDLVKLTKIDGTFSIMPRFLKEHLAIKSFYLSSLTHFFERVSFNRGTQELSSRVFKKMSACENILDL